MLTIGLTGGIASGKSLVARVFSRLGAHLIDADAIVHRLLEPGQPGWKEVADHFGSGILLPDKSIDRRKLGQIVFNDRDEREWLNRCLHPRVFETYARELSEVSKRDPDAIVVLDAALLIETGYARNLDTIVVVYADEEQQLRRLMERDGFTGEQARARIMSQMPLREKVLHADRVIDNSGSRQETERQAEMVFEELKRTAVKRA